MSLPSDPGKTHSEEETEIAGAILDVIVDVLVCLNSRIGFRNLFDVFSETKETHYRDPSYTIPMTWIDNQNVRLPSASSVSVNARPSICPNGDSKCIWAALKTSTLVLLYVRKTQAVLKLLATSSTFCLSFR